MTSMIEFRDWLRRRAAQHRVDGWDERADEDMAILSHIVHTYPHPAIAATPPPASNGGPRWQSEGIDDRGNDVRGLEQRPASDTGEAGPRSGQRCAHGHPIEACDSCWVAAAKPRDRSGCKAKHGGLSCELRDDHAGQHAHKSVTGIVWWNDARLPPVSSEPAKGVHYLLSPHQDGGGDCSSTPEFVTCAECLKWMAALVAPSNGSKTPPPSPEEASDRHAKSGTAEPERHAFVPGPDDPQNPVKRLLCWHPTGKPNDVCGGIEADHPIHSNGSKTGEG